VAHLAQMVLLVLLEQVAQAEAAEQTGLLELAVLLEQVVLQVLLMGV